MLTSAPGCRAAAGAASWTSASGAATLVSQRSSRASGLSVGDGGQGRGPERAGVVDQQVEPPGRRPRPRTSCLAVRRVGHVPGDLAMVPPSRPDGCGQPVGVAAVDDDVPAVARPGRGRGARPRPAEPPVIKGGGIIASSCVSRAYAGILEVEVNLKSSEQRSESWTRTDVLTVSEVAAPQRLRRLGAAVLRARGADRGATRTSGGQRRYARSVLRRLAFIRAARNVGPHPRRDPRGAGRPAGEPHAHQGRLGRISAHWRRRLDEQIAALEALRDGWTPASAAAACR